MKGHALRMRLELARLARRHQVVLPAPRHAEPFLPDCDGAQILSGFCSVPIVDSERVRFKKYSISWLPWALPKLCYRHGPEIGEVMELEWRNGGLYCSVTTDHPLGKRSGALSVAVTVDSYILKNVDDPSGFHAEASGWIDEISLVSEPACCAALVHDRRPVSPHVELCRTVGASVLRILEILQTQSSQARETAT